MKKLYITWLLFLLFITAACGTPKKTENISTLQGKTEAVYYTVKAPVDGEIRGLILDTGERIRKGQPLFGLGTQDKNPEVEKAGTELAKAQARLNHASQGNNEAEQASAAAALQEARNQAAKAQQNYEKMQRLYAIGGTSRIKMEQARLNLDSANAGLAAAQARLEQTSRSYTPEELAALKKSADQAKAAYDAVVLTVAGSEISSPSTGIVKEILVKNGDEVKKDQPVMELLSSTDCTIKTSTSISDPRIREGMEAVISVSSNKTSANKKTFTAVIREIGKNNILLFTDRKPEDIQPGTSVEVSIGIK